MYQYILAWCLKQDKYNIENERATAKYLCMLACCHLIRHAGFNKRHSTLDVKIHTFRSTFRPAHVFLLLDSVRRKTRWIGTCLRLRTWFLALSRCSLNVLRSLRRVSFSQRRLIALLAFHRGETLWNKAYIRTIFFGLHSKTFLVACDNKVKLKHDQVHIKYLENKRFLRTADADQFLDQNIFPEVAQIHWPTYSWTDVFIFLLACWLESKIRATKAPPVSFVVKPRLRTLKPVEPDRALIKAQLRSLISRKNWIEHLNILGKYEIEPSDTGRPPLLWDHFTVLSRKPSGYQLCASNNAVLVCI